MTHPKFGTRAIKPLVAGALFVLGCYSQQPGRLEFEVASIKPADPGQPMPHNAGARTYGTRAEYVYMTLRQLVAEAYRVQPFQIICPDWFLTGRFDISARMPPGSGSGEARLMLQALLADRFKLALHRESREEAVAALVVSPGGAKLKESPSPAPAGFAATEAPNPGEAGRSVKKNSGASLSGSMGTVGVHISVDPVKSLVSFEASRATMADLARLLTNFEPGNGRPVVDMTGLQGEYEFVLELPIPQAGQQTGAQEGSTSAAGAQSPAEYASDPGSGLTMRSLKSYGLELRKVKAPVEGLVVDHAERTPTAN